MATNSAFRWSPIGEVTESLTLSSRSMDEFYPELRVRLHRPTETIDCVERTIDCVGRTIDCVGSPQHSTGRIASTANACTTKHDKVRVYVRMRPFSESEKVCPLKQVLCLIGETIVVRDLDQKLTGMSKEPPHKTEAIEFKVDYMQDDSYLQVHSEIHKEESQKRMYGALGVPCIESALDGYNTTILAYGQTGSGKTYTMMGDNTKAGRGLIPRLANDLMKKINEEISNGVLYSVQVSYLEIYQEKIRDLLAEDEVAEESKTSPVAQPVLDSSGMTSNEKVRLRASNPETISVSGNNLDERAMHCYPGSFSENSYTSSFLNKAALQRQLEASQRHSKVKSDGQKWHEKPHCSSTHEGVANKVRSPRTKPAFETVFNKQKIHKHYRTFPTVLEEAPPVRKQNFLKIREHPITGPFVEGLLWKDVCTWYDMETLMKQGSTSRTTAATDMNEQSSRSHAVFSIRLTKKLGPDLFGVHPSSVSYINLVDLAGSEKLPKICSGAVTGQRTQEESRCINRSLSQLNEVILSLSKSSFVSYRNSVLTWLLKESLGGNSRTFMVANISPTEKDLRESINTLRYATTASRIPPPVALDQDPRNKLIKTLKEEICTLRTLLSSFTTVKENAPSGQLPSLQGFKVPCLDVGLQVERHRSDRDGSYAKKFHQHLDKGSQTENLVRENGQQTTSRSGSGDACFQRALKERGPLDMGNPTVLLDSGRVDFGHQTLILNVCACDSAHQAFAKDFGAMDVGIQVALKERGIVTLSQGSALRNCFVEDLCAQSTHQGCGSRACEAVTIGNQVASRGGNVGNQVPLQSWDAVNSWNHRGDIDNRIWATLQNMDEDKVLYTEDVDPTNQIKIKNNGGNEIRASTWGSVDAGNQITYLDSGNVDVENQITLRNCPGNVQAKSQISSTGWSPVDIGFRTSSRELAGIEIENHVTARDMRLTNAEQPNPSDYGSTDAGNQTSFQDHGVNKATNCSVVQLDESHQIDWREFGASDAGLQVNFDKPLTMDAGNQVSLVASGASDLGHHVTVDDQGPHRNPHNLNDCEVVDDELELNSSTTHGNSSVMIPTEVLASAVENPNNGYWRSTATVGVGHSNVLANLGAMDVSYEAGLRVGLVEERKEQFERKSLSDMRRGQQRTLLKRPGISAVQQESPRGASIGQTRLQVPAREDKESQSRCRQPELQNRSRATDVQLQTDLKTLGTLDVGLQTNWDSIGVRASQIEEGRSVERDTSHETAEQRHRCSIPGEHSEVQGECENGQCPDGNLVRNQNSVCLSLLHDLTGQTKRSGNGPAEEAFHLCSLWTLAKFRSRMGCYNNRFSFETKCRGLVSQPKAEVSSKAEVATQTASGPENSTSHETDLSNALQHICLLWVFIVLRIAAPGGRSVLEGNRPAGKRPPFLALATPGNVKNLSYLSDSAVEDRHIPSRRYSRRSRLRHLRYTGVERLMFQTTTPFFIQTSGSCSLPRTRVERSTRPHTTAADSRSYKIMCGLPSRRAVHFLKEGVNRLGSNMGAHIIVNGLSDDHTEFIYMPAHRCVQQKGYVVARLVSPGAMAFMNGQPMLEHKELCTGDVLVLRDLRYWSSVCTLHFFDLVNFF